MVEDFPNQASLPGGPKTGPLSDFSTYANILKIAESIVHECVKRRGEVGWQPTGKQEPYCFLILSPRIPAESLTLLGDFLSLTLSKLLCCLYCCRSDY